MAGQPKKTVTVRLDDETRAKVAAYRAVSGCATEAAAIRELVEAGLDAQGASLASAPLARFVREVMGGQLDLFRTELEARNDELEDRVARVCSRGTKASLHAAALVGDVARGLVPAYAQMTAEDVWAAYEAIGGAVQQGHSFSEACAQARKAV